MTHYLLVTGHFLDHDALLNGKGLFSKNPRKILGPSQVLKSRVLLTTHLRLGCGAASWAGIKL
jgi:hypothetical protein